MSRWLFLLIAAFVLLCMALPAVKLFGLGGGSFALYFLGLLVLLALIFRKQMLIFVLVGAVICYFWRPFSGSNQPQAGCRSATRTASALRGPYPSIDTLMQCDDVGRNALTLTGTDTAEYGFLIVRDRRQPTGGYYATPPVRSSQPANPSCSERPMVRPEDFWTSWSEAIDLAHAASNDYVWAATVHTHPQCPMASNSFTATDFNQAIGLKNLPPGSTLPVQLEKIVMINAHDGKVRTFEPRPDDQPFTPFGIEVSDRFLPYLNLGWDQYAQRVKIIATYPVRE